MELRQVGKYTVVEKIGAGAMGEVFRAHDPVLGRDVAIKVVLGKLSEDEKARDRFLREARAAAQLNHPNIITVYDFGEERGMAYMAMELLEGADLRALLREGKLTALEDKLAMMEQILDGLAFAHAKGVMHRDLKPGNVHVLPNGQIKIMDFGLARRAQDAAASGVVMGTPYYMAPEQAQGERSNARSDIFSLGAMFYEMLAGRRPFTGTTVPAVLFAVVNRDPEQLGKLVPNLPTGIVAMVMRALAKQPQARHADAGEMLNALRVALSGGEVAAEEAAFAADDPTPAKELGPPLSARDETSTEMREALDGIEQYLADRVPPLMVSDSVDTLLTAPNDAAAAEIRAWSQKLQATQPEAALVDVMYHALHKLSVIGELELVDNQKLLAFLREAGATLAAACPPGTERDRFRRALKRLGEAEMVTGPVERKLTAEPAAAPAPLVANTPGLKRLSILEQRLRREGVVPGPAAETARRRVASQAIAVAATEATNEIDLENHLRRLKDVGVASGAEQVFRSLGQELGDWALPKDLAADTAELAPPTEVRAMKQIVALPEDPVEVARRYRHLVNAATEQFNEGNLGRAVQMFELARKLSGEKQIEAGFLEPIQKKGHEALDPARLRQYMERPDRVPQLQEVMTFFEQGLKAETLFDQLVKEDRRDRRRLLLDLLVVHGAKARALARARLEAPSEAAPNNFARRNWIYLLRLIPRAAGEPFEGEIEAVTRCAAPGLPGFLVKEALTYLGQTRHPRSADGHVALLAAWEGEIARPDLDDAEAEEAVAALDRIANGLARQGGGKGWRALVRHGLSKREEFGDASGRLAELGSQDLSASPDVVETLSALVRGGLPKGGVLGRFVSRQDQGLPSLIAALAGTRTPEVRALLEEVKTRFATLEAGKAAARALEGAPAAGVPQTAALPASGELDGYSLPSLLHRLALEKVTGTLSLLPREGGGVPATIELVEGRLTGARFAHRAGEGAVYQLFERPFPGEFAFEPGDAPAEAAAELMELGALVREGLRRFQQVAATSAIVPEDAPLEATGEAPGTVVDEAEYDLIVSIWQKATSHVTLRQMEGELAADAFRILRPLALWLEQGALRVSAPPPAPGT